MKESSRRIVAVELKKIAALIAGRKKVAKYDDYFDMHITSAIDSLQEARDLALKNKESVMGALVVRADRLEKDAREFLQFVRKDVK